jgi:hypothetical protein
MGDYGWDILEIPTQNLVLLNTVKGAMKHSQLKNHFEFKN